MRMYEIREAARELGIIFTDIYPEIYSRSDGEGSYRYMTLGEFCRSYRTGVYLVSLNAHLAVVNFGVVVDPNYGTSHLRRRVYAAYRIENSTMTPLCPPRVTRDPLIKFVRDTHTAHPKKWNDQELRYEDTGIAKRYEEASTLVALNTPVRLSSVLQRTSYRRADFLYDLRHGNIVLEEE